MIIRFIRLVCLNILKNVARNMNTPLTLRSNRNCPGCTFLGKSHKSCLQYHSVMDLYLLRHGKAEKTVPVGGTDEGRPLTGRGRSEIQSIARWIRSQGCIFDYIATSPLIRAYETAAIVAEGYPDSDGPMVWEELSPGMECDLLLNRIRKEGSLPSLLLVGHEPSLSNLISVIISGSVDARIVVKKGGLAKIVNFIPDLEPCGDLVWLLSPALMQKMS